MVLVKPNSSIVQLTNLPLRVPEDALNVLDGCSQVVEAAGFLVAQLLLQLSNELDITCIPGSVHHELLNQLSRGREKVFLRSSFANTEFGFAYRQQQAV